ncbi:hypothetical protein TSMEX_009951 [Taenia solium]|eukprot:TsM_000863900 transcript=TsM_000863900 gene=TsM_000863900
MRLSNLGSTEQLKKACTMDKYSYEDAPAWEELDVGKGQSSSKGAPRQALSRHSRNGQALGERQLQKRRWLAFAKH